MVTTHKALTIDPLWVWAIFRKLKIVENRSWSTKYRGPLVIHAGLNTKRDPFIRDWIRANTLHIPPSPEDVARDIAGRCVGVVTLVDCVPFDQVPERESEFAIGPVCWRLANPVEFEQPFHATGKQGLWTIDI